MECSPFDYQRQDTRRREISGMTEISIEQLLRSNPIYVARYRWRLESATRSTFGASDAQRRTSGLRLHGGHRGLPLLAWERSGVRAAQGPGVLPDVLSRRRIDRMAQRGQHRTGSVARCRPPASPPLRDETDRRRRAKSAALPRIIQRAAIGSEASAERQQLGHIDRAALVEAGMPPHQPLPLDDRKVRVSGPHLDLALVNVHDPVLGNPLFLVEPAFGDAIRCCAGGADDLDHQVERPDIRPVARAVERVAIGDEEIGLDEDVGAEGNGGCRRRAGRAQRRRCNGSRAAWA